MNGDKHMKPLSKLNQEAIAKAKSVDDQNRAAAMAMIEKPIEMIKAIMLKHELAVIEVMRELHESREAAVRVERETYRSKEREWQDLSEAEINMILGSDIRLEHSGELRLIRAVEAALKAKNS